MDITPSNFGGVLGFVRASVSTRIPCMLLGRLVRTFDGKSGAMFARLLLADFVELAGVGLAVLSGARSTEVGGLQPA